MARTYGIELVITERGLAVIDDASKKVHDLSKDTAEAAKQFSAFEKEAIAAAAATVRTFEANEAANKELAAMRRQFAGFSGERIVAEGNAIAAMFVELQGRGLDAGTAAELLKTRYADLESRAQRLGVAMSGNTQALGAALQAQKLAAIEANALSDVMEIAAKETAEAAKATTVAGETTARTWDGAGPVVKKSANVITDALRDIATGSATAGQALGGIATSVGLKAVEEGVEGTIKKMVGLKEASDGAAKSVSLLGSSSLATTGIVAGMAVAVGAAAAAIVTTVKLTADWVDELGNAAEAQSKAEEPTKRQLEQYRDLGAAVGMSGTRLRELYPTMDRLVAAAKADPAGALALAMHEYTIRTAAANVQTAEFVRQLTAVERVEIKARLEEQIAAMQAGGFAAKGYGERLAELGQKFAAATPKDSLAQIEAVNRAFLNLENRFGSTAAAVELIGTDFAASVEQAHRFGVTVPAEAEKAYHSVKRLSDEMGYLGKAADVSPTRLAEQSDALASAVDKVSARFGMGSAGVKTYANEIKALQQRFDDLGITAPESLSRLTLQIESFGGAAHGVALGVGKNFGIAGDDVKRTAELVAAAATNVVAQGAKAIQDMEAAAAKAAASLMSIRASLSLTGEDDKTVKVDKGDARIKDALGFLSTLQKTGLGEAGAYASEAKKIIVAGNLSALEKLISSIREGAASAIRVGGGSNQAEADSLLRLAQSLSNVLGTLSKFEARASGGPIIGGRSYMVGERGPEPFIASASGRMLSNSEARSVFASSIGGGDAVSELRALRNEMKSAGGNALVEEIRQLRSVLVNRPVVVSVDPKALANSGNMATARNDAGKW